jgi:sterol desaturase/sphingolipid hydroxylase (fatty acid hydroxylase superfamily)
VRKKKPLKKKMTITNSLALTNVGSNINLFYILTSFWIPYFGLSAFFYKRKDFDAYKLCCKIVLFNTLVVFPLLSLFSLRSIRVHNTNFNIYTSVFQLLTSITCFEIFFYIFHRCFHHPLFYGKFHKLHHIFVSTIAFGGLFSHPFDFILTNYLPGVFGFLLSNLYSDIHIYTLMIWSVLTASYVTISHGTDNFHSTHHKLFISNFGTFGIMDKICGTYSK